VTTGSDNDPKIWTGQLPRSWSAKRLKRVVRLVNEKTTNSERPYLGLENIEPGTSRFIESGDVIAEGTASLFEPGDVLFGKLRPYLAKVLQASAAGRCTSELLVLRGQDFRPGFLKYALVAEPFIKLVDSSTFGAKMPRADWEFIGQIVMAVPPVAIQDRIASFLDERLAIHDDVLNKKKRLIELLEEGRQALITQAVTRGTGEPRSTKDSEVPWIGRVPRHWRVMRLKQVAYRVVVGIAEAATHAYVDAGGVPIVRSTNVQPNRVETTDLLRIAEWFATKNRSKTVHASDLLTQRTGEYSGVTAVVPAELDGSQCFTMLITTPKRDLSPYFASFFINSRVGDEYFNQTRWGTAQPNISVPILQNLPLPVPPRDEQDRLVKYLLRADERSSGAISMLRRQCATLGEYRRALIAAAVTGQLDISKEAA
jgi:type I restriction enzyme S subunit